MNITEEEVEYKHDDDEYEEKCIVPNDGNIAGIDTIEYQMMMAKIESFESEFERLSKENGDLKGQNVNKMTFNELLELEQTLFNSLRIVRKKMNEKQSSYSLCRICLHHNKNCVLIPCNHLAICHQCSDRINQCPICNQIITDKLTVYI